MTKTLHHLVVLPTLFCEHLAFVSVLPVAALRKAVQLADSKLRKGDAKCPAQDPTGIPCQSKGSQQLLQVPEL